MGALLDDDDTHYRVCLQGVMLCVMVFRRVALLMVSALILICKSILSYIHRVAKEEWFITYVDDLLIINIFFLYNNGSI